MVEILEYRSGNKYLLDTPEKVTWANKQVPQIPYNWRLGDCCYAKPNDSTLKIMKNMSQPVLKERQLLAILEFQIAQLQAKITAHERAYQALQEQLDDLVLILTKPIACEECGMKSGHKLQCSRGIRPLVMSAHRP